VPLLNKRVNPYSVKKVVLAVGNALNGSTFRGNARGFQLEALVKVFYCTALFSVSRVADSKSDSS